jgi:pretoxin HINT domain-containing protein
VTPDGDPAKNNWTLGAGSDPPGHCSATTATQCATNAGCPSGQTCVLPTNQGFGAEARWDLSTLGLTPGHTYRMQFMVHDGDQNKSGGDTGEACVDVVMPGCGNGLLEAGEACDPPGSACSCLTPPCVCASDCGSCVFQHGCFTGDTVVATAAGLRPIRDIQVGDQVWTADPETGAVTLQPAVQTTRHMVSAVRLLRIGGEIIRTNDEHPFWVEHRGWTLANELTAGDRLRTRQGERVQLLAATSVSAASLAAADTAGGIVKASASCSMSTASDTLPVYNLAVGGVHTFFVSPAQILVHNKN